MHPSRASGTNFEAVSGPAQFRVRTREAISAFPINAGAARFDRLDSLITRFDRYSVYVASSTSL
eukprot:15485125-Alexandrium_andersonii.AAC.1